MPLPFSEISSARTGIVFHKVALNDGYIVYPSNTCQVSVIGRFNHFINLRLNQFQLNLETT